MENIKIGDKFRVLVIQGHNKMFIKCKVIEIYQKKFYNMYLCESQRGLKLTFNDYELIEAYREKNKTERVIIPRVLKGW